MLDGDFVQLDARYNFVKRRLSGDLPVPDSTAILHFTGRHKPWQGGEAGYREAEDRWHEFELSDAEFHAAYLALPGAKHHDLLVHYGTPHVRRTGSPEDARKVAASHIAAGEYQEAADLLGRVRIPVDESWPHEVLGHALMSVSRYEEARARLLLATASPNRAPTAFARLAQIAWIHGDDDAAAEYALKGLAVDPTHRANRLMHKRTTHLPPPAEGPAMRPARPCRLLHGAPGQRRGQAAAGERTAGLRPGHRPAAMAFHPRPPALRRGRAGTGQRTPGPGHRRRRPLHPGHRAQRQQRLAVERPGRTARPDRRTRHGLRGRLQRLRRPGVRARAGAVPLQPAAGSSNGPRSSGCATTAPSRRSANCCPPRSTTRCASSPARRRSPGSWWTAGRTRCGARTPS